MTKSIILASRSPRRQELLHLCVKNFTIQAADIDERTIEREVMGNADPEHFLKYAKQLVERLAYEKAGKILQENKNAIVIGADTVVVHEKHILGKPANSKEAYDMLRSYAGKTHSVLTGVSIQTEQKNEVFSIETKVRFFDWNLQMKKEVEQYITSSSHFDKAGGYGIQETPSLWVAEIEGDYPNAVGLPVAYVNRALQNFIR